MLRCGSEFHLRFNAFQRLHHLTNGRARAYEHTCEICKLLCTEYYLITQPMRMCLTEKCLRENGISLSKRWVLALHFTSLHSYVPFNNFHYFNTYN